MQKQEWKRPLNFAICFHVFVAVSFVYGPLIFKSKPKHPEIYTVDLTSYIEPAPQQTATPPKTIETKPTQVKARKTAPIAEAEPVKAEAPKKAISLKPLKKKIKKKVPAKKVPPREDEKLKRQKLAEALRAEREAAEAAKIAQQEAELQRKLLEANLADARRVAKENDSRRTSNTNTNNRGSSVNLTGVEKQFYNAIVVHTTSYWQLPEYKPWDSNLETIVAVTIANNGKIKNMFIEHSSGDKVFDQFVLKALRAADPLPQIPPAMKKKYFDIGLRFKPGGIQ